MDQFSSNINDSTYKGSHIFSPLASMAGLPLDQFNFLLSQVLGLIFAVCFRNFLPPKPSNTFSRHLVGMIYCYKLLFIDETNIF
jgi:hypothetical protein